MNEVSKGSPYRSRRGRSWPIETRIDTFTGPEQDSERAADLIFGTRFDFNVASSKCSASCGITANDCAWIYNRILLDSGKKYFLIYSPEDWFVSPEPKHGQEAVKDNSGHHLVS